MKIIGFSLFMLNVPLVTPFKTALRTVTDVQDIVLRVETDTGQTGYGEAPPTAVITGDTHGSIIEALRAYIMPLLIGKDITDLEDITQSIQRCMVHNSSAKAAAEIAIYDLYAQNKNQPLYQVLGGGTPQLCTDLTISVDTVDKMVADSLHAIDQGYETLKIKVGKGGPEDIERIKAIHAVAKGRARLRLDANQGWSAAETIQILETLEGTGVELEFIEQPVKADDIDGLATIKRHVSTPVMADESAFNAAQVRALLARDAVDIINIKLMKTGGISGALQIIDIAAAHEVPCMIGCMLESSISVAAAAHLAVARAETITLIDLDGPSLCAFDPVTGGAHFDGPKITLSDAPGLGIRAVKNLTAI
ncbi:MAG: dipeptide epimerase [Robiginitomaculum sp.]|nr:MAG: dipeptide epimerase [Robiginitomaculum sp.]